LGGLPEAPELASIPVAAPELHYFKNMEEIEALPGYRKDINPNTAKVARLLGVYSGFAKDVPCGLTCCHTLHRTGVVIETADGEVTNIRHVCGGKYFEEYQKIRNQYEYSVERSRRVRVLRDLLNAEPLLRARITKLKEQPLTADWLQRSWRNFFESAPSQVINELRERARRNDSRIVRVERLHGEDAERARQFQLATSSGRNRNDGAHLEHEVGRLRGLAIWKDRTIRDVFFQDVIDRLKAVLKLDIPSLSRVRLRDWAEWAESIDGLLFETEALIREGREFFKPDNLALLMRMSWNSVITDKLRALNWDYATGTARNAGSRRR
jgi:hypothetical protein